MIFKETRYLVVAVCFLQATSTATAFQVGLRNNAFVPFVPVRVDQRNENPVASQRREPPPIITMMSPLVNPTKRRRMFWNSKPSFLSSSDKSASSDTTTSSSNATLSSELSGSMVRLLARFVTSELKSLIQDGEHKERVKDLNEQLAELEATVRETQEAQEKLAPTWKAAEEAIQENKITNGQDDDNNEEDIMEPSMSTPVIRTPASPVATTAGKHFTGDVSTNRTVTLFDHFDTEESATAETASAEELSGATTTDPSIPSNDVEAWVKERSDEIFMEKDEVTSSFDVEAWVKERSDEIFMEKDEVTSSFGETVAGNEGLRAVMPRIPSVISMDFGKPLPVIAESEGSYRTSTPTFGRLNAAVDGMGSNVVPPPSMSLSSSSFTMVSESVDMSETAIHTKPLGAPETSPNVTSQRESDDTTTPVTHQAVKGAHNKDSRTETGKPVKYQVEQKTHNTDNGKVGASESTKRQASTKNPELFFVDISEPAAHSNVADAQEISANVTPQLELDDTTPNVDLVEEVAHSKDSGSETAELKGDKGVTDMYNESTKRQPSSMNLDVGDKPEPSVHTNPVDAQETTANVTSQLELDDATPVNRMESPVPTEGQVLEKMHEHNTDSDSVEASESMERQPGSKKSEGVELDDTTPVANQVVEGVRNIHSSTETAKPQVVEESYKHITDSDSVEASESMNSKVVDKSELAVHTNPVDATETFVNGTSQQEADEGNGSENQVVEKTDDTDSGSAEASESMEQQPIKQLTDEELAARYAAIPDLGERAFAILLDLGMIQIHSDPDDPNYDHSHDDEFCV